MLRVIELFTASGGLAEGLRRACIAVDLAFDRDADACASYEANLGVRPVQMDVRDLVRMLRAGWRPADAVDLLVADPPCAPWSRAGKKQGQADERDVLAETAEVIALLRPGAYLVGNIPGLQDRPAWPVVQRVLGGLARHGYCAADFAVLDAADFSVPQRRVRPYWFGHIDGPCIRWPAPTHCDPAKLGRPSLFNDTLRPWVTVREALQVLPREEWGRPARMKLRAACGKDGGDRTRCSREDAPAQTIVAASTRKGGQILIPDNHAPSTLDRPSKGINAKVRGIGGQVLTLHDISQSARWTEADAPAPTLTAQGERGARGSLVLAWPWRIAPPGNHAGSNMSQPNSIVLSERAALVLQGFPPDWKVCGATKRARWEQIGQAVPPAVGEAIGRAILARFR